MNARSTLPHLLLLSVLAANAPQSGVEGGERWTTNPPARLVLGQADFESSSPDVKIDRLVGTIAVAVDPTSGKVFVADRGANRVLRFSSFANLANGAPAEIVLGQDNFDSFLAGTEANRFNLPSGIAVGPDGTLWVADTDNHRVLRFGGASGLPTGAPAVGVLGQADFTTGLADTSSVGMEYPEGLAVDATGRLWVADSVNHRVLRFDNAAAKANGDPANGVLGQTSMVTSGNGLSASTFTYPRDVAAGPGGELYVVDSGNNRVLRFNGAAGKSNGGDADAVLGATNFGAPGTGTSSSRFSAPTTVALDPEGTLWVGEANNRRVMGFASAAGFENNTSAAFLLGQADFASSTLFDPPTRNSTAFPYGLASDGAGRVYVGDGDRLVVFSKDRNQPDLTTGPTRASQRGRTRYNGSGIGQTTTVRRRGGREARFFVSLWNDGTGTESFRLRSNRANARIAMRLFQTSGGRRNVTGPARRGNLASPAIVPTARASYELRMRPTTRARTRTFRHRTTILARSVVDGERDLVGAILMHRR